MERRNCFAMPEELKSARSVGLFDLERRTSRARRSRNFQWRMETGAC